MTAKNASLVVTTIDVPPQQNAGSRLRILVVDDNAVLRKLNTEVLSQFGYHVESAQDGLVACDIIKLNKYDLLITDQDLPKLSGFELLRRMRVSRLTLPVIMATQTSPKQDFSQYPFLRPVATLQKPYTLIQLVGKVQQVLGTGEVIPKTEDLEA